LVIEHVKVAAVVDQASHQLKMLTHGGDHQRRPTKSASGIAVDAMSEKTFGTFQVPSSARDMQGAIVVLIRDVPICSSLKQ